MSRRAVLWIAFAIVHVGVAWAGFVMPNEPMGDVYRVYEPWSSQALEGLGIVGITSSWVYPQLAIVPMVLAHAFDPVLGYTAGWAALVTAVDAVAFAVLVGRARSRGRVRAAWFWLAFTAALGPAGLYRLDGFTVPLAILGCLWLVGRPWAASILLAAATWIKVWPAALLAAAVVVVRRRLAILGGAAALSAVILGAVVAAGGAAHAFGFVSQQTGRGLQIESVVATPYLWGAMLGIPGFGLYYSSELLTFQVDGPGVAAVVAVMTPLLIAAMGAIVALGALGAARGVGFASLYPVLSFALVLAFIVCNKVGSPQYLVWLVAPVVLGLVVRRREWVAPAVAALVLAWLTQLVYPTLYHGVLDPQPLAITVLTLRNLGLAALFGGMVVRLVRVVRAPVRARRGAVAPSPR